METEKTETAPNPKQVMIRATPEEHERWKTAAEREGKTLTDFVRDIANAHASEVIDCPHPETHRERYPWQETCLKCGTRLWG